MDKEQLFEDGVRILENMLNKWLKYMQCEDNLIEINGAKFTRYYIFLPKIESIAVNQNEMSFPVYTFEKDDVTKLCGWVVHNLEKNEEYFKNAEWDERIYEELNFFDYNLHKEYVCEFAQVFFLSRNLMKYDINTEEYKNNRKLLYEIAYAYGEKVSKLGKGELVRYDVPDDAIFNIVNEKEVIKQEEIKGEKKQEIEKQDDDIVIVLDDNEAEVEQEKQSDFSLLIKRLNAGNSENKKYEHFKWDETTLLNHADDSSLEIAYYLIEKGKISLGYEESKISINSHIASFCNYNMTNEMFLKTIESNENKKITNKESTWKYAPGNALCFTDCHKCKYQSCPKVLAAYILYLKNIDKLKEKLEERQKFREELKNRNDFFLFEWKNENGLKKISDEAFNFANELVNKDYVRVYRNLNKDGYVKTAQIFTCKDIQLSNFDIAKFECSSDWNKTKTIERSVKVEPDSLCNVISCRLPVCAILVAAYIYYLKKSGQEYKIKEDREYYAAHKEEIDKEIEDRLKEKLDTLKAKKEEKLQNFKNNYAGKIENLNLTLNSILESNKTSFHCIVVGDDEEEKDSFIENIVHLLKQENSKIGNVRKIPMKAFADIYRYSTTVFINEHNELIFSDVAKIDDSLKHKRDSNKILYDVGNVLRTPKHEDDAVYVLNEIKEFVSFVNESKNDYASKRRIADGIAALTNIASNNYIILKANKDEIDTFIALDPRIKFIYQNNIITLPTYSIEDMYDSYIQTLNTDLLSELRENEDEYKRQFNEYVSVNKSFMPFNKNEIVNYMANYANARNELVLPPYVYKKETVEESLNSIVGLENVKEKLKEFEKFMLFQLKAKANNINIAASNMHMIFNGNPGTGKTTIARIMAKMLFDLGVIKENKLIEVERKDLIGRYIGETAPKTAAVIDSALGGVLFIDEAYSLYSTSSNDFGKEAVATLIKAMEDHKNELVVIFAGYKNEMKKFIEINPGIASRIGYNFDFEDYSVEELMQIYYIKLKNMNFEYSEDIKEELEKVCTYYSKRKDFGNGRFIDKLLQETFLKHALNEEADIKLITESDIPTIEDMNVNSKEKISTAANEELDKIIGLESLKEQIKKFAKYANFVKETEKNGVKVPNNNMHMMFVGNPGTGKTTIARIMAKMLFDIDVIHENKLIEVERKDLVGDSPNKSAEKVSKVIEDAMGGILFIDEAYSLSSTYDNIKKTSSSTESVAIATLIKAMEDHKGEFIVIFAGYKDEMKTFMDMNSGIKSRVGYTFEFDDYTEDELIKMFNMKLSRIGFSYQENVEVKLRRIFKYFSGRKSFGNGRFVDRVIQETIMKHSENYSDILIIDESDIPTIEELTETKKDKLKSTEVEINNLVGLNALKEKLHSFADYVQFIKEAEERKISIPNSSMHMIFTGNPGTGKTTVARIIAKMLFEIGVIHENKLIEVERKDLIAGYVGQTAIKTAEVIEKALGGVLFIDEAYEIARGRNTEHDFGAECVTTLIKAMEDHKDELVVIFAGYRKEMKGFLNTNPGIASRVGYTFDFEDYSDKELTEIFRRKVKSTGMSLEEGALEKVQEIMKYFYKVENIGNGRFVDKVLAETLMKHSKIYAQKIKESKMNGNNLNENEDSLKDITMLGIQDLPTIQELTRTMLNGKSMIDPSRVTMDDMRKTAIHEVGHATIGYLLFKKTGIKKITCAAEGWGALGYVEYDNSNNSYTQTKEELLNKIKRSLAGIGAEEVFIGVYENGGTSDLEKATLIARNIITNFGMSDLGLAHISGQNTELEKIIYDEENKILGKCFEEVKQLILENKEKMERVVDYLLEHKEMTEEEFINVFNGI